MEKDIFKKVMLSIIAILLLLNFLQGGVTLSAEADKNNETGRYQISAWAAQIATGYHHSGYYIVDTATGKVIENKSETHTSKD